VRPEEEYALDALVSKFGGEYSKGDEPPDAYLVIDGKKIAVEVSMLVERVNENGVIRSRLSDDAPVSRISDELEKKIGNKVPENKWIFLVLPSPIKGMSKFKKELTKIILELISENTKEKEVKIFDNLVSIYLYENRLKADKKFVQAISTRYASSNIHDNCQLLLQDRINVKNKKCKKGEDADEYWLALLNSYWQADFESYKRAYKSLEIEHNFNKICLIDGYKQVFELR
jgi:hypothetical protein